MNWRFLVADDPTVAAFVIRDADSRVSLRDRWAIEEWLASPGSPPFHVVRDHPSHANYPLMGGTWGARTAVFRGPLPPLSQILGDYYSTRSGVIYGSDIGFLSDAVWKHMKSLGVVQHDSHSCGAPNHGIQGAPFPRPRAGVEHVGAVYVYEDSRETVRLKDLTLLIASRGAPDCVPPPMPGATRKAMTVAATLANSEVLEPTADFRVAARAGRRVSTAWKGDAGGLCGAKLIPSLLHWGAGFVERFDAAARSTAVFDYGEAMSVGGPRASGPANYDERVPASVEPIQALDGGVRYARALVIFEAAVTSADAGLADKGGRAVGGDDAIRVLRALADEGAFVLLPSAWAAAATGALKSHSSAEVRALAPRIIDHEVADSALYYATHVYVHTCV
jgi:hypothetical protein